MNEPMTPDRARTIARRWLGGMFAIIAIHFTLYYNAREVWEALNFLTFPTAGCCLLEWRGYRSWASGWEARHKELTDRARADQ